MVKIVLFFFLSISHLLFNHYKAQIYFSKGKYFYLHALNLIPIDQET